MKAGVRVSALPLAKSMKDMFDFPVLVLGAFTRINVGDMDDGLLVRIEDAQYVVGVGTAVEEIPNVQSLKIFVAVQLLIVGVCNRIEL